MIGKTISHYKILEKLGEGGMGVVYKAEDIKLDRLVALKFLPSHLIDDEKALNRLLKEAKSASKINHPNVCTIHAIEEYEDTHFIVMEYVDGETLKAKVKSKPLSLDEAAEYSIQICKALKAAHDKDIIHRDIKSENIMINLENMVKVMDFGLAKLKDEAGLTKTGTAGTIAYMAPEQLQGFEVDTRTDIWSFGVVLYEMLTGQLPFKGEYESAMMYSIVNTNPEPISDVPNSLEQIVNKMLAKSTDERYQNVNELIEDLKKIPSSVTESSEEEKSIVVLPFVDMSPDKDNEYFSDGLTEEIITDLSHIHELRVISRTSAMMLKGTKKDMKTISRELNVQYVLEGSVRKAGNNLRITAQLIDAINDKHLWAEKYSGTLDDVFDIQEKVSRTIVDALKVKLTPKEDKQISERPIDNIQAYDCYLRARQDILSLKEDGLDRAVKILQTGLDIIGDNPAFHIGLAQAYYWYYEMFYKQDEATLQKAEGYAKKVIALDPDSAMGNYLLGSYERVAGDLKKACKHMNKAISIDPNNSDILLQSTWMNALHMGKPIIAKPLAERLLKIDPLTPLNYFAAGIVPWMEGHFDLALELLSNWYKMAPDSPLSALWYAWPLVLNNKVDEAIKFIDKTIKHRSHPIEIEYMLFLKYALQGDKSKSLETLTDQTKKVVWNDPDGIWLTADLYGLINEKEQSLNWLERMIDRGWINYPLFSEIDPFLENIRSEERFKKLMERVKYEWENFEV